MEIDMSMIFENSADSEIHELDTVYRRYYKNVYNYIAFRINNHHDTEELVSAVFEKHVRHRERYNSEFPMEGWLIGIAKNQVTDYLRKKMRRNFVSLDCLISLVSPNRQPEEIVVKHEGNRALMAAMAKLKNQERQILSMKFATDLKHSEIAKILNITESNVGVITHRALKKLKGLMKEEDGE